MHVMQIEFKRPLNSNEENLLVLMNDTKLIKLVGMTIKNWAKINLEIVNVYHDLDSSDKNFFSEPSSYYTNMNTNTISA